MTILDQKGNLKSNNEAESSSLLETDIAGPCCFAGDIVAHKRMLPKIDSNDFVMLHDVGGYYHSSYSKYNLRQSPVVYGYWLTPLSSSLSSDQSLNNTDDRPSGSNGDFSFIILQKAETVEETLRMFTLDEKEWSNNELP